MMYGKLLLLFCGLVLASCSTKASLPDASGINSRKEVSLIPRTCLFGFAKKSAPRLSPNGKYLAYLAPKNNCLTVWVRDLQKPNSSDREISSDEVRGIRNFFWQFDNEHILYIKDVYGNENGHLYQTSIQTGETRDLTPYENVKATIVAYNSTYPNEILIQLNLRNKKLFDVYRINLDTGTCTLDTENDGRTNLWVADKNLHIRVAESFTQEGLILIRVRDEVTGPWRDFTTLDSFSSPDDVVLGFTPDEHALCVFSREGSDTLRLIQIDLITGKRETLVEDRQYDLRGVLKNPRTSDIEAAFVDKERPEWIVIDPQVRSDFDVLHNTFCEDSFDIISRDDLNQHWIVMLISDRRPPCYYLYNRDTKKVEFLFSIQPDLEKYTFSQMTPISFQARDGMTLYGYLTLPVDKEPKALPTVILVHGGPWIRDSWGFNGMVQWLANRGYAVLQINFRGSGGYGTKYMNAGNREWGDKMQTDLIDGKNWAIAQGYSDPAKIALCGGSYGGYAVLMGLTFTPDEFCAGVDFCGPSNLVSFLTAMPSYWEARRNQIYLKVGNPEMERDFLLSRSPISKVGNIKKPLLIIQGENDPRVQKSESGQFVAAMRQKALPVEYLVCPEEGHGIHRFDNNLRTHAAIETFLMKALGGRRQFPSRLEDWEPLKK